MKTKPVHAGDAPRWHRLINIGVFYRLTGVFSRGTTAPMHCATDSLPQSVRSLHVDCLHNANPELKREVLLFASLGLLRFETGISKETGISWHSFSGRQHAQTKHQVLLGRIAAQSAIETSLERAPFPGAQLMKRRLLISLILLRSMRLSVPARATFHFASGGGSSSFFLSSFFGSGSTGTSSSLMSSATSFMT